MRRVELDSFPGTRPASPVIAPVVLNAVGVLVAVGVGVALVAWLLSVVMLPTWIGASMFAYFPIQSLIAIAAIIAIAGSVGFRPNGLDLYFGVFLVIALAAVLLAGSNQAIWAEFAVQWGLSYLVARVVVSATGIPF